MAATYPAGVKSFSAINTGDTVQAQDPTVAYDEITAMQQALLSNGLAHKLFPDASVNARSLGDSTHFFGLSYLKNLTLAASTELTVATGAVTATQGVHRLDTESNAASDDLDTITPGTGIVEGALLLLRAEDVTRVVTLKDTTGNLLLNGDYALSATDRTILLFYDGTNWREVCRSVGLTGNTTANLVFAGPTSGGAAAAAFRALVLADLPAQPCCRVTHGSMQAVANSTDVALTFTATDVFDTDTMHDTATNPTRITFTTAGKYHVGANIAWQSSGSGTRNLKVRLNGSTIIDLRQQATAAESEQGIATFYQFAANDYIEILAYQNSGGSLNVATAPIAWAYRVGA